MSFEYLCENFSNIIEKRKGNEPWRRRLSVNGDYFNWYEDTSIKGGGFCEEYHGECINGEWSFGSATVFVQDTRQFNGKYYFAIVFNNGDPTNYWMYTNKNGACDIEVLPCCDKPPYVSEVKLRKILNQKEPSKSIAYKLFIVKAKELFELGDWKGEDRDL